MTLADIDRNQRYTYADYLKWKFEERVELIRGMLFPMAAPNLRHQDLAGELNFLLKQFWFFAILCGNQHEL